MAERSSDKMTRKSVYVRQRRTAPTSRASLEAAPGATAVENRAREEPRPLPRACPANASPRYNDASAVVCCGEGPMRAPGHIRHGHGISGVVRVLLLGLLVREVDQLHTPAKAFRTRLDRREVGSGPLVALAPLVLNAESRQEE